jgi:hypothetical protein
VRRATRSGEVGCSRSASYSKKRRPPLQQKCVVPQEAANYIHADPRSREAKEVEAASKAAAPENLRCKATALEARVRILHSAT